jgi:hypothetical protein
LSSREHCCLAGTVWCLIVNDLVHCSSFDWRSVLHLCYSGSTVEPGYEHKTYYVPPSTSEKLLVSRGRDVFASIGRPIKVATINVSSLTLIPCLSLLQILHLYTLDSYQSFQIFILALVYLYHNSHRSITKIQRDWYYVFVHMFRNHQRK